MANSTDFNGNGTTQARTTGPRRPPLACTWLDVGDRVRIVENGLPGKVMRADRCLVGMVYEVAHLEGVSVLLREDLDYEGGS